MTPFKLKKAVEDDKRSILYRSLQDWNNLSSSDDEGSWVYLCDYDDSYVYFEKCTYDSGRSSYKYKRASYQYNGTSASIGNDVVDVVPTTEYKVVTPIGTEEEMEKSLDNILTRFLEKHFGSTKKSTVPVIKGLNEVEMIAVEVLYITAGTVDGAGDTMDADGVADLVKSVNDGIESGTLEANYFHKVKTTDFHFLKAWVNPYDCYIGNTFVPKDSPLIEVKYTNKAAWDKRVSGELMGLSIEGTCQVEEL